MAKYLALLFLVSPILCLGLRIAVLGDLHMDPDYVVGSAATCLGDELGLTCCRGKEGKGGPAAGRYGASTCDTPEASIRALAADICAYTPDFAIMLGDIVGHHLLHQTPGFAESVLRRAYGILSSACPGLTWYSVIGNHDTVPVDTFPPAPGLETWHSLFQDLWANVSSPAPASPWLWWKASRPTDKLMIIGLNTLLDETHNIEKNLPELVAARTAQRGFVTDAIAEAKSQGYEVWIMSHKAADAPEAISNYTQWMTDLVRSNSPPITQLWAGHVHSPGVRAWKGLAPGYVRPGSVMPQDHDPVWLLCERDRPGSFNCTQRRGNLAVSNSGPPGTNLDFVNGPQLAWSNLSSLAETDLRSFIGAGGPWPLNPDSPWI